MRFAGECLHNLGGPNKCASSATKELRIGLIRTIFRARRPIVLLFLRAEYAKKEKDYGRPIHKICWRNLLSFGGHVPEAMRGRRAAHAEPRHQAAAERRRADGVLLLAHLRAVLRRR